MSVGSLVTMSAVRATAALTNAASLMSVVRELAEQGADSMGFRFVQRNDLASAQQAAELDLLRRSAHLRNNR